MLTEDTRLDSATSRTSLEILSALHLFLTSEQIRCLEAIDLKHLVSRPRGPYVRVFFSRKYGTIPDIDMPADLWHNWLTLTKDPSRRYRIFHEDEWQSLEMPSGTPLSQIEPNARLYGYREGAMEVWTDVSGFAKKIDDCAREGIEWCKSNSAWREDSISEQILTRLNALSSPKYEIEFSKGERTDIAFSAYKQSGTSETNRGDIAFVIVREDSDRHGFAGVGYMEAKKRDTDGSFDAFRDTQLARIIVNEPAALVALYDDDPRFYVKSVQKDTNTCRATILPMKQVARDIKDIDNLCRYSTTIGHQIAIRYLNGADLRLCENTTEAVLTAEKAKYIAIVGIGGPRELKNDAVDKAMARFDYIKLGIGRVREHDGGGQSR